MNLDYFAIAADKMHPLFGAVLFGLTHDDTDT
jgi:hypothetical protein